MKKRIVVAALVAVSVACGVYFGLDSGISVPVLAEGFGIWESEVLIDDASPGATGTVPVTIINGKDRDRTFVVTLEQPNPNKVKVNYVPLLVECSSWVTLPDESIHIAAGDYHTLSIPFRVLTRWQ